MVAAKNTTELYNGDFERLTTADGDRAYCDTLYNEGVYVGKYLVTNILKRPSEFIVGAYGEYVVGSIADSCLGTLSARIYADSIVLGTDGVTLTRAAATNFLCGVMDAIDGVDWFSNITIIELYARKDTTTGGGARTVKFVIGDAEFDPEGMVRPVSKSWYQSLSKNN